jgi:RNA polymerase sigma-70 factor (ECF subfamily)
MVDRSRPFRPIVAGPVGTFSDRTRKSADMAFDPRMSDESDAALLERSAAGDALAAAELYRRHSTAIYRFVWATTGSEAEAADVLQETFMTVLERRSGFDPARGGCTAYLCGVARHLVYRRFDKHTEACADVDELAEQAAVVPALPTPHDEVERMQALTRLHAAIRALPPHYRDILVLVELQEMSYADTAAIAGIELGTVRSRLARARARLTELLGASMANTNGQAR